jgi:hypothetical protein
MPAAPKEPLTGVPEALEPQSLPKVANGLQHMVCGPEGAVMHTNQHPPSLQGPLPGSVAGYGGSDSVAHRLGAQMGAPVTQPKRQHAVPQHNVGTRHTGKESSAKVCHPAAQTGRSGYPSQEACTVRYTCETNKTSCFFAAMHLPNPLLRLSKLCLYLSRYQILL